MPVERTLRQIFDARMKQGEVFAVLEKDYAISYVLAGIASVPELYEILLFKGGTCLRKAYFATYRFSIDLDYTISKPMDCSELGRLLFRAVARAEELMQQHGPFKLSLREVAHRGPHERGQCEHRIEVAFPWMRSASCALKVEVLPAPPEVIVGVPEERMLYHVGCDESVDAKMRCYELREIASEKLRSFLQVRARYDARERGERAFVRSRPRDLFDLAHLHRQTDYPLDRPSVRGFLERKAEAFDLEISGPEDLLDERVLEGIRTDWDAQLGEFIRPLPTFDECLSAYRELLARVFE
jgi:predicted nucleotidyltransferase component of viral defense system